MAASSLAARADRDYPDLTITTYQRKVNTLIDDYMALLEPAKQRYQFVKLLPAVPEVSGNQTHKVSITLRAEDWIYIDSLIAANYVRSRSQYFRQLFRSVSRTA
ncbi:hypothetical protein ACFSR7_21505 [Cohnella sp. GCM10020058]|uniref:hypothetical protein n=1 Tax=Cohnella sp. GCM10020058 TaxID=3317330 RepID=UPI003635A496